MDLSHVLWIGGATGSGKTSISRALAYRHDLQLYNVDLHTYDHVERLPPVPKAGWERPPDELDDRFLAHARERWPLLLEDLDALPSTPGAIAEGPFLLPELIPPGATAVFLLPGEERLRATAAERRSRPVLVERNLLLARRLAAAARDAGFPVVEVDRPLARMTARVEALFAAQVEALQGFRRRAGRCLIGRLDAAVRLRMRPCRVCGRGGAVARRLRGAQRRRR